MSCYTERSFYASVSGREGVWQMVQAFLTQVPDAYDFQLAYAKKLAARPLRLDFAAAAACLDRPPEDAKALLANMHAAYGGKMFTCRSGPALRFSALRHCMSLEVTVNGAERDCVFSRTEYNWNNASFGSFFQVLPRDGVRYLLGFGPEWRHADVATLERHLSGRVPETT